MDQLEIKEIGKRIRERRKELGLKIQDLAIKCNSSCDHIKKIDSGRANPSLDLFIRLCRALGVSPNYLLQYQSNTNNLSEIIEKMTISETDSFYTLAAAMKENKSKELK